jgi:hypothetical protein
MLCHILLSALFEKSVGFGMARTGHRWLLIQFCLILRSTYIEHHFTQLHIGLDFSIFIELPPNLPGDLFPGLAHCAAAFSPFFSFSHLRPFLGLFFTTVYLDAFALLLEGILHYRRFIHKLTVRKLSPSHVGVCCRSFPGLRYIPSVQAARSAGLYAPDIFRPIHQLLFCRLS